jgi:hypothetical protein
MEPRTLEGTWEEISRHAAELAGRKVRLTVLDAPPLRSMLDVTLAELIKEAEQLKASRPSGLGNVWQEGVAEKFRRQGFTL